MNEECEHREQKCNLEYVLGLRSTLSFSRLSFSSNGRKCLVQSDPGDSEKSSAGRIYVENQERRLDTLLSAARCVNYYSVPLHLNP